MASRFQRLRQQDWNARADHWPDVDEQRATIDALVGEVRTAIPCAYRGLGAWYQSPDYVEPSTPRMERTPKV